MGAPNASGLTRIALKLKDKFAAISHNHSAGDLTSGTLGVSRGGTGKDSHTSNAVLTGNGSNAVNNVSTANGAFYATSSDGAASFGTLPVAQGGTGATTAANARTNLDAAQSNGASGTLALAESAIGNLGSSIATVEQTTATANHAAGDYFMLGNVLMRATSAIATGEQITTSNATPATVQSQIDTLRDSVSYEDISSHIHRASVMPSSGTVTLCRSGGVCFVECSAGGVSISSTGWVTLATIDAPYRPKHRTATFGLYPLGTMRDVAVETNGILQMYVDANTNKSLRCCISYPIDVNAL